MSDKEEEAGRAGKNKIEEKENSETQIPLTGKRVARRTGDIHGESEGSQMWLISFTDVMALMLTFFVLLFSMAEPTKEEWSEMISALQMEFNKFYGSPYNIGPEEAINLDKVNFNRALDISYLEALLEAVTEENRYLKNVKLIPQNGQLIIALPSDLLFDPGQTAIKEDGARALYSLAESLRRIKNRIEVTGHADPRPVSGGAYESNWDLSLARAATVAGILESVGYQRDIGVRGHSSGRYEDLNEIVDENQRLDLSRRVDVVVMDHDGGPQKVISPIFFK